MYMIRRVLTRETRWCQNKCSIFYSSKVICEKPFSEKTKILTLVTSGALTIDLSSDLTKKRYWGSSRAIDCFFGFFLAIIVSEIMTDIPERNPDFRNFDIWWPLVTSFLTWAKNWPKSFRNDFWRAFERFFRLSLRFLGAELEGVFEHPPPQQVVENPEAQQGAIISKLMVAARRVRRRAKPKAPNATHLNPRFAGVGGGR